MDRDLILFLIKVKIEELDYEVDLIPKAADLFLSFSE